MDYSGDQNQIEEVDLTTRQVDRISNLPDDVITNRILSLLPTIDSVRTSALSTRWKHLYASVTVLDFEYKDGPTDSVFAFTGRVSKVLNTVINKLSHISVFRVRSSDEVYLEDSVLRSWIETAVSHSVRKLDVCVSLSQVSEIWPSLPHCLFTCETLVSLRLSLEFALSVPDKVCLPKLKDIWLGNLMLGDNEALKRLFSSCPVLESLTVCSDNYDNDRVFNVSVPSLRFLSLCLINTLLELVINCPNLEDLDCDCYSVRGCTGDTIGPLKGCSIRVEMTEHFKLMELVKKVSNVQFLFLASHSMQALLKTPCSLPKFENLTHLKLESYDSNGWKLLPSLLDSSPRLVDLDFVMGFVDEDTGYCRNRFPPPEHVPVCLSHHLKVISFGSFLGEEDENKWVEYFLTNGLVLEKMKICLWWRKGSEEEKDPEVKGEEKEEGEEQFNAVLEQHFETTRKRLLTLQRSSDVCQVIIEYFVY